MAAVPASLCRYFVRLQVIGMPLNRKLEEVYARSQIEADANAKKLLDLPEYFGYRVEYVQKEF